MDSVVKLEHLAYSVPCAGPRTFQKHTESGSITVVPGASRAMTQASRALYDRALMGLPGRTVEFWDNKEVSVDVTAVTVKAEVRRSFITTTVRGQRPSSHHKGATGTVRTGDQRYPVLCRCKTASKHYNGIGLSDRASPSVLPSRGPGVLPMAPRPQPNDRACRRCPSMPNPRRDPGESRGPRVRSADAHSFVTVWMIAWCTCQP